MIQKSKFLDRAKAPMIFNIDYDDISGRTRYFNSFLRSIEAKLTKKLLPFVPPFVETNHLTLLTIPLSATMIISCFLAKKNINWLWFNSLLILLQYLTDVLDGAIGRHRRTGLIRWGFYMDHFLDFVFACSIVFGYAVLFSEIFFTLLFILIVFTGHFIHELLSCIVFGKYHISGYYGIGSTEIRFILILINIFIIIFGSAKVREISIIVLFLLFLFLIKGVYKNQKLFWSIDMRNKKRLLRSVKRKKT